MSSHPPPVISLGLERLKSLPVRPDVWQLGFTRMPSWVTGEGEPPFRPYLVLCHSAAAGKLGSSDPSAPGDPMAPAALAAVAGLAVTRGMGYRPNRIEVRDPQLADAVRTDLAGCGIEVQVVERLDALDEVIAAMMRHFGGQAASTRSFEPSIEVARLRGFAEAAVEFHRAAPWNLLSDGDLVQVESPAAPAGLACFTVLGGAGIERGLGFFPSRAAYERFQQSEPFDPRIAAGGLWLMGFDGIVSWPIADAELWEEHDLPVADERAFPSLICHQPRGGAKPADAEHLAFAEVLLRALAATTEDELDSGRWQKTVAAAGGPVTVELSLPGILETEPGARPRAAADRDALPDRRLMERTLRDLQALMAGREFASREEANAFLAAQVGKQPAHTPARTPEGRAQELVDRALEEQGRLRLKLAREALRLWPGCAEAWVLQAEEMPDPERRLDLYRNAVEAGERALGPKTFVEHVGHFWGLLETRPYMRARLGLAGALWDRGRRDEAIAHWLELLRLNPGDNQGVRLYLVPRLLELGRDAEAQDVLAPYEEDESAVLAYARALLEFRRGGPGAAAQAKLDVALRGNAHVPRYLTGRAKLEGRLPDSYRPGADDEAQIAAADLLPAWMATEGAVEWLRGSIRPPKRERRAQRKKGKRGRR